MLELKWNTNPAHSCIFFYLIIVQCLNWNIVQLLTAFWISFLIIVQCLNWNNIFSIVADDPLFLIIVQCLNWNEIRNITARYGKSYNRTMLELKSMVEYITCSIIAYNRTMLELKLINRKSVDDLISLIIVQCLNWNDVYAPTLTGGDVL